MRATLCVVQRRKSRAAVPALMNSAPLMYASPIFISKRNSRRCPQRVGCHRSRQIPKNQSLIVHRQMGVIIRIREILVGRNNEFRIIVGVDLHKPSSWNCKIAQNTGIRIRLRFTTTISVNHCSSLLANFSSLPFPLVLSSAYRDATSAASSAALNRSNWMPCFSLITCTASSVGRIPA